MKRVCAFMLCGALLLSPALAAGDAGFSDVPAGIWYEQDAAYCRELGLMKGTGADTFSPNGTVTVGEVMVVAARLHNHANGGGWDLPKAPEAWGTGAIYGKFGVKLLSFTVDDLNRGSLVFQFDAKEYTFSLSVDEKTAQALTPAGDGGAEVELERNGVRLTGGSLAPEFGGDGAAPVMVLKMPRGDALRAAVYDFEMALGPNIWYRDALYYLEQLDLYASHDPWSYQCQPEPEATRLDLAGWLNAVLPEGDRFPINQVEALPDLTDPAVLALYRAGILGGATGTAPFTEAGA